MNLPFLPKNSLVKKGKVTGLKTVRVEWQDGKMVEVAGSEQTLKADLVLLAMGFVSPVATVLDAFGIDKDARGNAKASTDFIGGYETNVPKCLSRATCAVAKAWWCGRFAKAARQRVRLTSF